MAEITKTAKTNANFEKKIESKQKKQAKRLAPFCIKCGSRYTANFYQSVNHDHITGFLPYCKTCLGVKFEEYFMNHNREIKPSLYFLCRIANVPYKEVLGEDTIIRIENEMRRMPGKVVITDAYKYYFTALNNMFRLVSDANLSFDASDVNEKALEHDLKKEVDLKRIVQELHDDEKYGKKEELLELRRRFGKMYNDEELTWLGDDYDEWEKGNNLNTVALKKMTEDICKVRLSIRQAKDATEQKKYYDILKDLLNQTGLKPIANSGISDTGNSTIGMTIKTLEETKPADIYKLKSKYQDIDNIEKFFKDYFRAPMKVSLGREDADTESMEKEVAQYKLSVDELKDAGLSIEDKDGDA